MKKTIDNYLTEHEHEMIQALSAAIAIPSVKDAATASSRAPFGKEATCTRTHAQDGRGAAVHG